MSWVALSVFALAVFSLSRCTHSGFWSPVTLFLIVLGVFHLGLLANILTGIDPEFPRSSDYIWYDGPIGVYAIFLTTIAIVVYVLFSLSALTLMGITKNVPQEDRDLAYYLSNIGAWLLLASTVAWFLIAIISVGIGGLLGSYQNFLVATQATPINLTYITTGVGLGMTVLAPARRVAVAALIVFALFACLGFFLGLRGEVLFPLAVAVSVLAQRRSMPNVLGAVIGLVSLLAMISLAREVRVSGLSDSEFNLTEGSPVEALTELGSTLRVVATVVHWHEAGDPFRLGDTYTVTLARTLEQVTQGSQRIPAHDDMRLFNVEILNRAGGVGGSLIGEAYHNFAVIGVIGVMAIVAVLLSYFSRGHATTTSMAVYVIIAVPLFTHIRNSFVPVIPAVVVGLIFLGIALKIGRNRMARKTKDAAQERLAR